VSDRTFLQWPFFADRHGALAEEIERWSVAHLPADGADVDAACRHLVRQLGRDGWLAYTAPDPDDVVFARTGEAPAARGLSAFLVPGGSTGLAVAERLETIAPHPLARLTFDGVRVPAAAMIGAPGDGFKIAMATLDIFRATVGAAALGFARRALDETIKRASSRNLFGGPLADLQMVQGHIADMALDVDAAALLVYRAAWTKDKGAARITREASMAKLFATDRAQRVIDTAVQLHGGDGVRRGHIVEKLYREIRALRIYEGASEIQKVVIARQTLSGA
jgi:acyl-CoA dehydrogenase